MSKVFVFVLLGKLQRLQLHSFEFTFRSHEANPYFKSPPVAVAHRILCTVRENEAKSLLGWRGSSDQNFGVLFYHNFIHGYIGSLI